jgi:hypothetical protein
MLSGDRVWRLDVIGHMPAPLVRVLRSATLAPITNGGGSLERNQAMRTRLSAIVAALAIATCAVMFFARPADGQHSPVPAAGRFQIVLTQYQSSNMVFVFEPDTGRCWSRRADIKDDWSDLGSPAIKQE